MLENRRQVIANSSCGVCGRATIDELARRHHPARRRGPSTSASSAGCRGRLRARQSTFEETGGLHGAAVFAIDGALLASAEDVGRHNAVDKSFGSLLLQNRGATGALSAPGDAHGQRARVVRDRPEGLARRDPIVAAVSAPTSLAIELAPRPGITLLGFVREAQSEHLHAYGSHRRCVARYTRRCRLNG